MFIIKFDPQFSEIFLSSLSFFLKMSNLEHVIGMTVYCKIFMVYDFDREVSVKRHMAA